MQANTPDPISRIANAAMVAFADRAARRGMLPLSGPQVDAAVVSLRSELKAILTDSDLRAAVETGNETIPALAFDAMVGAALVAAAS